MTDRIRNILRELDQTRENLLALSDDIWLSIDHNNTVAMREGADFKEKYNEKMAAFDRLADELSALVQKFTKVKTDDEPAIPTARTAAATERVIRDLDQKEPHSLDEDFTYKRPYGFRLEDEAHSDVVTWRRLYTLICHQLARRKPQVFKQLPENPAFISPHGNPGFSHDPKVLRWAMELPDSLFAEANLSANGIRDQLKKLLVVFGIDTKTLRLYLRQDRDAEV